MRSHFHHQGWLGGLPVAQSWNVLVKPMVSLRACGARPSADGQPSKDGLTEEGPETRREAAFSEILCWVVKPPWFRESGLPGNETLG